MTDPLLNWYNKELEFFRQMGAEFARSKPKIASRLSLDAVDKPDPHVERMVQAFAYLNARIRYKLDDDFPELTDAILGVLYPHFLQPVPSLSILQFELDESQGDLTQGHRIPRGTAVESERVDDETCRFQTTSDLTLYPLTCSARLQSRPFSVPPSPRSARAEARLRLELTPFDKAAALSAYGLQTLRCHIHLAQFQQAAELYELLFDAVLGIVVASSDDDRDAVFLPAEHLSAGGFDESDALLPWSRRSFPGYRLLTEYFSFPRKFLSFDIHLTPEALNRLGNRMEISVLLSRSNPGLEQLVREDTVRLGCTPVVNLFAVTADAITLSERQTEYRIIPDARRENAIEIYTVDEVLVSADSGETPLHPFYSVQHTGHGTERRSFWHATRKPGPTAGDYAPSPHGGTEMYLSLVDTECSPLRLADGTLHAQLTCFNRNLPVRLPFGSGRPRFDLPDGRGPISTIRCLAAPSPVRRPDLGRRNLWKVVSQLSLNHLSIDGTSTGRDSLREILRLYDLRDSADTRDMIEGLVRVSSRRTVHRIGGVFARGVELDLLFDDEKYTGSSPYLLASVLNHFFGMYTSINSFTRLVATTLKKQSRDERWEWEPRASDRCLV